MSYSCYIRVLFSCLGYVNDFQIPTSLCNNCGGQKHVLKRWIWICGIFLINGAAFLLTSSTILPLYFLYVFSLRNRWGSRTLSYYSLLRVHGSNHSIVLRRCSYFISFDTTPTPLVPSIFMTSVIDSWVMT